uniref:SMC hinge domain-containing protein n=1 Tax=Amorphochlora amoebiformis TaxID=1561963 RepID=A0A7S0D8F8_9EUKA
MTDEQRLELLKDIAGTKTYDERRKESLKVMAETDSRTEQINEVISQLEKRLGELEGEKEELEQFRSLDTERRSLEYAIYDKELVSATEKLDALEKSREDSYEEAKGLHKTAAQLRRQMESLGDEVKILTEQIEQQKEKLEVLKSDQQKYAEEKARCEMKVKAHKDKMEADTSNRASASDNLQNVTAQISKITSDLAKVTSQYEKSSGEEARLKHQLQLQKQRLHSLCAKKGRAQQFRSKADRDKFLKRKLKEIKVEQESNSKQTKQIQKEFKGLEKVLKNIDSKVEEKSGSLDKKKEDIKKISKDIEGFNTKRNEANHQRKKYWRVDNEKKKEQTAWREKLELSMTEMKRSMDRHLYSALRAVRGFVKEEKIEGYYGPLIGLFKCDKKFRKCVEITASNRLFQIVVDNDKTASRIIDYLAKKKAGRLTFMPLNRLNDKNVDYPVSSDALPMIDQLEYDSKFQRAMQQVFGGTLITRDLETGTKFSRTHRLNTITMDGDQVNKKGALSGGFVEHTSRLTAFENKMEAEGRLKKIKEEKDKIEAKIETQNQIEAKITGQINKSYAEKRHLRNVCDQLQVDVKRLRKDSQLEKTKQKNLERELTRLQGEASQFKAQMESLQSEIRSDLVDDLNSQDQSELDALTSETTELEQKLIEISNVRAEAESKKRSMEENLSTNLRKREEELRQALNSQSQEEESEELEKENEELKRLTELLSDFNSQVRDAEKMLDDYVNRHAQFQGKLEKLKSKEASQAQKLESQSKDSEKYYTRRNNLMNRQKQCRRKIRDVGALSKADYNKYSKISAKVLMNKLAKCNDNLKEFSHVNKKAIDQYISFSNERSELLGRKQELDKGGQAIRDLIAHLDRKKDEAIVRTFKGIAKHFKEVFKKLVPKGKGVLVIRKKMSEASSGSSSDSKAGQTENFRGVGIKVSFSGVAGGDRNIRGLSGGQQSIVALSLIFAIQRCDPSPFYLFDEIDANLDAVYRRSVAEMINEQSASAQFITTTFRPELLLHANKFYGVVFKNKMSKVSVINGEVAKEIISEVEKGL